MIEIKALWFNIENILNNKEENFKRSFKIGQKFLNFSCLILY